jgi:hypothetical protein
MSRDTFPRQQGGAATFGELVPRALNSAEVDLRGPPHQQAGRDYAPRWSRSASSLK